MRGKLALTQAFKVLVIRENTDVEAALNRRRQWLLDQGFAREADGEVVYARNLLATLQRRELARAGARRAGPRDRPSRSSPNRDAW
ncbi:MAG: DUF3363 domain-containing protein [Rhodoplanes sp.]